MLVNSSRHATPVKRSSSSSPTPEKRVSTQDSQAAVHLDAVPRRQAPRQQGLIREIMYWGTRIGLGIAIYKSMMPKSFEPPNIGLTTASAWGPNVNVMAGGSQQHILTNTPGYTDALADQLSTSMSLGEAQSRLSENGYINRYRKRQFPISSNDLPSVIVEDSKGNPEIALNQCLNTWNKDGRPEKKFAILLGGPRRSGNYKVLDKMHDALKHNFHLLENQIQVKKDATRKAVIDSISQFADHIQQNNIKDAELLIYFNGHGTNFDFPWVAALSKSEGDATGHIALKTENILRKLLLNVPEDLTAGLEYDSFSEKRLKALLKKLPPDVKTTVIMDTCHAGSWIA